MSDVPVLEIQGISKSFPGVKALDDVSFAIKKGEVHALCGENGAGKSTLIKILAGAYRSDAGKLLLNGREVAIASPVEGQKLGISVVHQELKLAENLSVAENVFLGRPRTKKALGLTFVDWARQRRDAGELMERLGIRMDLGRTVSELSIAQKQIVEIAKALSLRAEIIIMDEPSATLTNKELDLFFAIIDLLKQQGVTIIYVSHRLEEIFQIADRITVLRDGRYIGTVPTSGTDRSQLIAMMVGRELESEYPKTSGTIGGEALRVSGLNRRGVLRDIHFHVRKGEIVGIAGLVGSGRTELARAVFGADPIDSGDIRLHGRKVVIKNVRDAIMLKMALVPEDRKGQGLVLGMTVRENISLVGLQRLVRAGLIDGRAERRVGASFVEKLRIKTPQLDKEVKDLSGGNQQKVVLAKWLLAEADVLFFDEPTRGIDVGAKAEIYRLLGELASQGKAIVMISSELPEILGMCDRILVMRSGAIAGELSREEATQEAIMSYAVM